VHSCPQRYRTAETHILSTVCSKKKKKEERKKERKAVLSIKKM
jgi:hypothetical protein